MMAFAGCQHLGDYLDTGAHFGLRWSPFPGSKRVGVVGLHLQLTDFTAGTFVESLLPLRVVRLSISLCNNRLFGPFGRCWSRQTHAFPADFSLAGQASPEERCLDGAITFWTPNGF